jgi:hypothetical protein
MTERRPEMTNERIDEILGTEPELVPSSGFAASVMERIREEAAAPAPIPFPWKRAVPGMVVAAGVFGWSAVELVRFAGPALVELRQTQAHVAVNAAMARPLEGAGWVIAALAVSLITWMISRRVAS